MKKYILALDQGTSSSRAIIFDSQGKIKATSQKEFTQIFQQDTDMPPVDPMTQIATYQQEQTALIRKMAEDLSGNLTDNIAQAVGQAVGRNPISIIIPCHRVVGRRGSLTGYAAGLATKEFLLNLEQRCQ